MLIQMPIHDLPVHLVLSPTGEVGLACASKFATIVENTHGKPTVVISMQDMLVGNEVVCYNTLHQLSEYPEFKGWLKEQHLEQPY